jgi:class 3 adenylate cyclase
VDALPSGTITFLFTDIEGSTELLKQLREGYAEVLGDQRRILRETLGDAGGREMDTQGDAFFFSFTRARDAVEGAVRAQSALQAHEWPKGAQVRVRMGLHTGEPAVGDEGYVGLDVVRAARICSAGHGGQILLSDTTRALIGSEVPEGTILRDLGAQKLKDLEEERIYELARSGAERFPALKAEPSKPVSHAEILGEDFGQRIQDYVNSKLEGALPAGLPGEAPPAPPAPPPPPAPRRRRVRPLVAGTLAIVVLIVVVLILVLLFS